MTDQECVEFLQWALPQLRMRWAGFRKVRRQVHKRIHRRMQELGLDRIGDYRRYLVEHPSEWTVLDRLTSISISRFYRDRRVFDRLRDNILPELARNARDLNETGVRCWCIGCASGEEPYTLTILWDQHVRPVFPDICLDILGTDRDPHMLERARHAAYPPSSLKDAPASWRSLAFDELDGQHVLRPRFREAVQFCQQDIRRELPDARFPLALCRNLVFTYFADDLQRKVLRAIAERMLPGGFLVIGKNEMLPEGHERFEPYDARLGVYQMC